MYTKYVNALVDDKIGAEVHSKKPSEKLECIGPEAS